jgi:NADPH:quinone reductase-like Zn-dependent oxidoreductase
MIVGDPPVVLGFEGVGEIEELGPSVTGFSVGEPARRMTISSAPFS